ncbi:MAG: transporter substrate-binding domain-containing protein [Halopseudomonas sp.]
MQAAYRKLGIPITIVKLPPERSLRTANSGQADAELARVKVDLNQYKQLIRVPVAIDIIEATVFSKTESFHVAGWDSLKPYKIGIRQGVKFTERGTRGMDVISGSENIQLFKMLNKGRVDIVVMNKHNALKAIKELGLNDIRMLQPSVHRLEVFHYLHFSNQVLLPRLTEILQQMESSGEIEQIMQQIRLE